MSRIAEVVDYVMTDLVNAVPGLADAVQHRYVPWNPEELYTDARERHVAVWPLAEEDVTPLSNDAHEIVHVYQVLVWEDATGSGDRRVADEAADLDFLDLHEAIRARFYVISNQFGGGSELTWYEGSTFPDDIYLARWFAVRFNVRTYEGFTP